jgi:hypothetical protein
MSQFYSDPTRENDKYHLPNCEVFQLTAREEAELNDEIIHDFMKRKEFRLASMNGGVREKMFDAIVEELNLTGGWFWWYCLPGCMADSEAFGPYDSEEEAIEAAREWDSE